MSKSGQSILRGAREALAYAAGETYMRCEKCHGMGWVDHKDKFHATVTCPECQGSGITYCCDEAGVNLPSTRKLFLNDTGGKK